MSINAEAEKTFQKANDDKLDFHNTPEEGVGRDVHGLVACKVDQARPHRVVRHLH